MGKRDTYASPEAESKTFCFFLWMPETIPWGMRFLFHFQEQALAGSSAVTGLI